MTGRWTSISAGAAGSAHADGVSQDAHATRTIVAGPRTGSVVAAVADGHGGARYVRSGLGARAAVDAALSVLTAEPADPVDAPAVWTRIWQRWRDTVLADHRRRPFTEDERRRLGEEPDPLVAYGSTLIAALAGPEGVRIWQLGDGDVLAADADGTTSLPVPPDPLLSAGRTTSLCSADAATTARTALILDAHWVLLATDGYGNAFADADWRTQVGADLHRALREHGPGAVASQFPQWLRASAETGGDDASAVLLVNAAATVGTPPTALDSRGGPRPDRPAAAPVTAPGEDGPRTAGIVTAPSVPAPRRRPHPAWWVAVGVLAGAVTAGALHLATSAGRSDPPPARTEVLTVTGATTQTRMVTVTVSGPTAATTRTVTVTPTRSPPAAGSPAPADPGDAGDRTPPTTAGSPSGTDATRRTPVEQVPPPPAPTR